MDQALVLAELEKEADVTWSDDYPLALTDRPFSVTDQITIFINHSVVFGEGKSISLGTGFYRYLGIQYLSIMYRTGEGVQSLYAFADRLVRHYSDMNLNANGVKIVFGVASTVRLPQDAKGFSQLQVVCPFYFDTRS